MANPKFTTFLVGFVLLCLCISGYAGEPTLQSIQIFGTSNKITKAIFLYHEKNFRFEEKKYGTSLSLNNNRTYLGDTGFPEFGDLLVANASQSFAALGLPVIHSGYAPEGRLKDYENGLGELLGSQIQDSVYVILTPSSANTVGNNLGVASVKVELSAQVIDAITGRPIWIGQVNTATRIGKGFFAKQLVTPQTYYEAYAAAIFKLLVDAWHRVGLL